MSTYAELTTAEKTDLAIYDKLMRGAVAGLTKLSRTVDTDSMAQFGVDSIDPILAKLDPAEIIPNSTSLAGAKDLTATEYKALQTLLRGILSNKEAHSGLIVKAAGVNA